jgi:hypothetical protein
LKKRIKEELIGSASKKKEKEMSPMHPAISVKQSKATYSPDKPTADQQFLMTILASLKAGLD